MLGLLWPFRRIRPASAGSRRRRGHRSAGSHRRPLHVHRLAAGQQLEQRLALAVANFGPLDAALFPVQRGSFVYGSAVEQLSTLAATTDVVDVATTLAPGCSQLSAFVKPIASLQVRVDILDATGAVLATRSATRPGESFNVGPIDVAAGGTYTFRHLSLAGTTGTVSTALQVDVKPEGEAIGGHTNDAFATAESLAPSLMTFGTATRQAVFGQADIGDVDTYSMTLAAGQPLSVNFSAEGPGGVLTLNDAAGGVVATGVPGVGFTTVIDSYTAPAAGTYYLKFNNNSGVRLGYSLVTVSNGRLESEPNDSIATAGALPVGGTVLASLGGEYKVDPLNPFRVDSLPFRFFFNALGQFDATVDQRWSAARIGFLSTSTLQIAGTNYNAQGRPGTVTFPVVSSVRVSPDASWLRVTGQPLPGVEFERLFSWHAGDTYVTVTTTIRNVSGTAISGVKVLESHNPTPNRVAATSNDVTRGGKLVVATASGASVGLATNDPRAVLSAQGDTLGGQLQVDPSGVLAAPIDPNGATSDTAINAAFDLGTIAAGGTASCTFAMLFGSGQPALESLFDTLTIVPATGVDVDYFAVAAAAGQTLKFQTLTPGVRVGDNPDVRLDLLDQAGNVLAGDDDGAADGRNAVLSRQFTAAGTYYVRVSASAKPGTSPRGGSYALVVSPPSITTAGALAGLTTTYGTASATTQVAVTGAALAGAITASAPAGFEVS
ncbi:MAG: hypothetical protein EBX36_01260, partial [Planctomycetia bacterium]|nr:hypothetical protein [Planctomycetia bacterium]